MRNTARSDTRATHASTEAAIGRIENKNRQKGLVGDIGAPNVDAPKPVIEFASRNGLVFSDEAELVHAKEIYWAYLENPTHPFFYRKTESSDGVFISKRWLRKARNTWLLSLPNWCFTYASVLTPDKDLHPWWLLWRSQQLDRELACESLATSSSDEESPTHDELNTVRGWSDPDYFSFDNNILADVVAKAIREVDVDDVAGYCRTLLFHML